MLAAATFIAAMLPWILPLMHERYLMPALVVGAIVACADRRYAIATLALACTFTVNCAFILRGFYGGAHHPIALLTAHALSAVNVAAFIWLAIVFFRTPAVHAVREIESARSLRTAWR